jgi:hypothetical protein
LKGYFIQYKFIIPASTKHSSYSYQKLFRALYGYTQNVTKSNGKTYIYHREGVLSTHPFIRPGKNCVIIPPNVLQNLLSFFKTGKNPSHYWAEKGDWKAVYYLGEKQVKEEELINAINNLIDRCFVYTPSRHFEKLIDEMESMAYKSVKADKNYKNALINKAQDVCSSEWFKLILSKSNKAKQLNRLLTQLKSS